MVRAAFLARGLLVLWLLLGGTARAASPAGDELDDPKLARRLGARINLAPPTGSAAAPPPAAVAPPRVPAPPVVPPPPIPTAPAGATAPPAVPAPPIPTAPASATTPPRAPAIPPVSSSSPSPSSSSSPSPSPLPSPSLMATAPSPDHHESGRVPTIGLGYRRFNFIQVGATNPGSTSGIAASEPFDSVSLDIYPISRLIRFGLSTQYGWQGGRFNSGNGDYFIAQSASLGVQHAGPWITPFAEAFAGGGYMRRFQFDRTIPTAFWQFGLDAGASFFLPEHGFVSLALGYLRPVNGFAREQSFASVYVDTWSVKLGFGL